MLPLCPKGSCCRQNEGEGPQQGTVPLEKQRETKNKLFQAFLWVENYNKILTCCLVLPTVWIQVKADSIATSPKQALWPDLADLLQRVAIRPPVCLLGDAALQLKAQPEAPTMWFPALHCLQSVWGVTVL